MPFDYTTVTAADVTATTEEAIAAAEELVAAAIAGERTFEGTMRPLDEIAAVLNVAAGRGPFMARVHPDGDVRATASEAEERMTKWSTELVFRDDLYGAVKDFAATADAVALNGERRRLLDFWLRDFRRAGHELDAEARGELRSLKERLVELEVAFNRNIDEYRDHIEVSRNELDGLPDAYIAALEEGDAEGTYRVSLDYPEYFPYMRQATSRHRRQELEHKNFTSAPQNRELLAEATEIRAKIATLFGLGSWAHYRMEDKMAKGPDRVSTFYDGLVPGLEKLASPEFDALRRILEEQGQGAELRTWDYWFLDTQMRKRDYGIDADEVAQYFPLPQVMEGMFDLTGEVFGLRYRKVDDAQAWHDDVELYEIIDAGSDEHVAHFFVDLFPRDGKFTHAAAWDLIKGRRRGDGTWVAPVAAIVANFTKPREDRPSLLKHDEVTTLFHEFGHVLHACLTRAELTRFAGFDTEWDFVEAPSQIMEHWCWEAQVLTRFARHHETGEPIPETLVKQLVAARNLNQGTFNLRQVFLGKLDLGMHGPDAPVDLQQLYEETYRITGFPVHEGTHFYSGFGHLMGGYDAGYYGYLWSKVYGDDMFSVFATEGVTSPDVGSRYRDEILSVGGSRDAMDSLIAFLGREPNNEAFLRYLGLER